MENGAMQDVTRAGSQEQLANDVAFLYSWAKIENAPYRDFSRQRISLSNPVQNGKGPQNEDVKVGLETNNSQGAVTLPMPPATATIDVCGPAISTGLGPQPAMPAIHQPTPAQLPDTPGSFPEDFTIAARPGIGAGIRELDPARKASPVMAVYSIAGGVGKTTLCANLGKTLCSLGEQVLLVDASGRGLLPFYFGATELRTGARKFAAPGANAPFIQVIAAEEVSAQWLDREVKHLMATAQRTIFDLGPRDESLLSAILDMCSVVLVPLLPDLNSILTVSRIETLLNAQATGSKTPAVFYLFNRFDEHSMNDQRARDFVVRHCGHRLLPIRLRHGRELTEALHGGLAGADHTPGSELSHDYLELALWVRSVAPLRSALVPHRWSEQ
jgi:cellulose synthase operon protein YhjQ